MASSHDTPLALRVLCGTETGNAELVASEFTTLAQAQGMDVELGALNDVTPNRLTATIPLAVIISTTGDGEMPITAERFWAALTKDEGVDLGGMPFAVLGLGDTGYFEFCRAGELMDSRLAKLGGRRMRELRKCDYEFEHDAKVWIHEVLALLGAEAATPPLDGEQPIQQQTGPARHRQRPHLATVRQSYSLTGPGAIKPVQHVQLAIEDASLPYQAGDSVAVMANNDPALVDALLEHLGESGDRDIDGSPLRTALTETYEISRPSAELVTVVGRRSADARLTALLTGSDRRALQSYLWDRDVLDLLGLPTTSPLTTTELLDVLRPLAHRSYSISSSPLVTPGRVDLAVASLRYRAGGRDRTGVCSAHLGDRLEPKDLVRVFLVPNNLFRLPADDHANIIMIGPGTGVAPFRAFLQERRIRNAQGSNWLFFGARHERCDFLYRDELAGMHRDRLLSRLDVAFSRDSQPKTYVQHLMKKHAKVLYQWLADGAYLYVCGDATRMAGDVDRALEEIVAEQGGLSSQDAIAYINALRRERRYLRDVY